MHKSEFARTDAAAAKVHSNFQILPNSLFTPHHSPLEGVYIRLQGGGGLFTTGSSEFRGTQTSLRKPLFAAQVYAKFQILPNSYILILAEILSKS